MANGYTFEREDDGYRFFPEELDPAQLGNRAFFSGNGPILISALIVFIAYATHLLLVILVALGVAGWLLYNRFMRPPSAAETGKTTVLIRAGGVLVTPARIVPGTGEAIPAARINSIDVSNEFDDYMTSMASSPVQFRAGSTTSVAAAIGHDRRLARAKTRHVVTVQHGPAVTVLMKRLSVSGANGLQADIRRVLGGQSLD